MGVTRGVCCQCPISVINGWVLGEVAPLLMLAHEYWGPVFSSYYNFF
jgi:hypothetical protein